MDPLRGEVEVSRRRKVEIDRLEVADDRLVGAGGHVGHGGPQPGRRHISYVKQARTREAFAFRLKKIIKGISTPTPFGLRRRNRESEKKADKKGKN
jgi:hypothetical protein